MIHILTNIPLMNEYKIERSSAERIAMQAGNDMSKALALAQNSMLNFKDELTAWFRIMLGRRGNEIAGWASKMGGQEKEEQKQFALYAIASIRDILKEFNSNDQAGDGREMIKYMHENFNAEVWYPVMNEMQSAYEKIGRNANTKLLWLATSIQIKNYLASYRLQHINT